MNPGPKKPVAWTPVALYSLLVLCLVAALGMADAQLRTLLLEPLKRDLHMSDTQFGQLGVATGLCAVLAAFPMGWLADRMRRGHLLAICAVVWSSATVLAGLAQSFGQFLAAGVGLALGEAAMLPILYAMVPEYFSERQRAGANAALYAVILLAGGASLTLGGAAYQILDGHAAALVGAPWRTLYFALGVPGLAVALLLVTLRASTGRPKLAEPSAPSGPPQPNLRFRTFLRDQGLNILLIDLALATYSIAWALLVTWSPAVLSRSFGMTVGEAGVAFGSVSLAANIAGILAGWWVAHRWLQGWGPGAHLRLVKLGAAAAFLPMAALWLAESATAYLMCVGMAMATVALASSQAPAIMQDMAPGIFRSRTIALFPLIAMPVTGLYAAVGFVSDSIGSPDGLRMAVVIISAVAIGLGLLLLSFVQSRYCSLVSANRVIDARSPR